MALAPLVSHTQRRWPPEADTRSPKLKAAYEATIAIRTEKRNQARVIGAGDHVGSGRALVAEISTFGKLWRRALQAMM
jgi:hypothetical protein